MTESTITPAASDDALVAQSAAGDATAFEMLVARYQDRVYRLACRLTSETDAPDVLQDTFLNAYRNLGSFRGDAKFSTWLFRIATNAALMIRRRRGRRPGEPLDAFLPRFDERGRHDGMPEELKVICHVEERIDRGLLAERARAGIERLPDLYRDAFVLRDLEDMSTAEVAEVLGIETAAVRQRVHRARLLLRGYLSDLVSGGTS